MYPYKLSNIIPDWVLHNLYKYDNSIIPRSIISSYPLSQIVDNIYDCMGYKVIIKADDTPLEPTLTEAAFDTKERKAKRKKSNNVVYVVWVTERKGKEF